MTASATLQKTWTDRSTKKTGPGLGDEFRKSSRQLSWRKLARQFSDLPRSARVWGLARQLGQWKVFWYAWRHLGVSSKTGQHTGCTSTTVNVQSLWAFHFGVRKCVPNIIPESTLRPEKLFMSDRKVWAIEMPTRKGRSTVSPKEIQLRVLFVATFVYEIPA